MRAAKIEDFDLASKHGRYQARKAGFDVPKMNSWKSSADFDSLISKNGSCWEWLGTKDGCGYGRIYKEGKEKKAHREMYLRVHGSLMDNQIVMHSCDNPGCVNPDHLSVGSHKENQADKVSKGRQAIGEVVGTALLTELQVSEMRRLYQFRKVTYADLALKYGVHKDTIRKAIRGINWRHVENSGKG